MAYSKKALLDGALILAGAGISTLFLSVGNGQNPVPVAAGLIFVVLVTGLISFLFAIIVRTVPLAIVASVIITDMLFILWVEHDLSSSSDPYADEAIMMFPIIFLVATSPTVVLASIGFGRLAGRFWRKRRQPDEKSTPDLRDGRHK
jgi:hypothetical protein